MSGPGDANEEAPTEAVPLTLARDVLWGAKAIGAFLDCSVDRIASLRAAGAPIGKAGGTLVARRGELYRWIQRTIANDHP